MSMGRSHEKWFERMFRVINSTVCFSLAYIFITFSSWFVMGLAGLLIRFDSFIYYYGIKYIHNDRDWTKLKVSFIFSSASLYCLGLGLFCWFLFRRLKNFKMLFNIFLVWVFIIGTTMFCSQALIAILGANKYASPFYQNWAVVYAWWHLPSIVVYFLALPVLGLFGYSRLTTPSLFCWLPFHIVK
jgi:hypothetical protein